MNIETIRLHRDGLEGEGDAVVSVEIDGVWCEVLREPLDSNFSSAVSAVGVREIIDAAALEELTECIGEPGSEKRKRAVANISGKTEKPKE